MQKGEIDLAAVPSDAGVMAPDADFREGEVTRRETCEEAPDVHKETFIREEVNVRKEVEHDVVEAQTALRKEQLDVNTEGDVDVNTSRDRR